VRYLVTGATGFIGGHLVRQLRAAGHNVTAVARSPRTAPDLVSLGVALHEGDVRDKESLRVPMRGTDGVFHIAASYKVGVKDPAAESINVAGTRNVLELVRELGIPKCVYTSTLAVFSDTRGRLVDETYRYTGRHLSEYDRTKWVAHYEVVEPMMRQGVPVVIVQPGVVYGPGDTSATGAARLQYLRRRLAALPQRTAFCWGHVADTVAGHVLAMERGRSGESYIIAGPPHTLVECFDIAERITGIPAPRLRVHPALLRLAASVLGAAGAAAAAERLRVIAGVTYLGSSEKAERELGFRARPLGEGLRETLAAEMRELGMAPAPRSA
jgi:nucleoside-diphosphate-sugar epimerase